MSRFHNRNFELLEPYEGKLSRTVLRGERGSNAPDLLDTHIILVDTGNSYQGLCELIHNKTKGEDGVYFTYTQEHPISFNPFYTDDGIFEVEKKESLQTLLLTLWKSENEKITKTESAELGSALEQYIELIQKDQDIVPCFNTFYEFLRDVYRIEMESREIEVSKSDFNIYNLLTTLRQYYRGGRYDFLLNSEDKIDLLSKRFIVFEIDQIKENKELFPVVTIIIMEAFLKKMRLFAISLSNRYLTSRKSRIGNDLETSETLWSA